MWDLDLLLSVLGLSITCFAAGYWVARMQARNRWPHPWSNHYRKLFERQLHETEKYKAMLFDAWKNMRGQTKGLQRQARKLRRLKADVEHWQTSYKAVLRNRIEHE